MNPAPSSSAVWHTPAGWNRSRPRTCGAPLIRGYDSIRGSDYGFVLIRMQHTVALGRQLVLATPTRCGWLDEPCPARFTPAVLVEIVRLRQPRFRRSRFLNLQLVARPCAALLRVDHTTDCGDVHHERLHRVPSEFRDAQRCSREAVVAGHEDVRATVLAGALHLGMLLDEVLYVFVDVAALCQLDRDRVELLAAQLHEVQLRL